MDDHDSPARGEVETSGEGQPKPTATVSGEMVDLGNPGAATISLAPVDYLELAAPEKSVLRRTFRQSSPPPQPGHLMVLARKAHFEREPIKTPSSTTDSSDSDNSDVLAPTPTPPPQPGHLMVLARKAHFEREPIKTPSSTTDSSDSDNSDVLAPTPTPLPLPLLHRVCDQAARRRRRHCCIYEIPYNLRERAKDAYAPLVVKLGPLEYEYRTMESIREQKWCYLQEALSATGDVHRGFQILHQHIRELEQQARECYSKNLSHIDSNEFVTTMVLDGCFILQILLKETERHRISSGDPIFEQRWLFLKVKRDLMLLPCQIPFFVLERLFDELKYSMNINASLCEVVYQFFRDSIKGPPRNINAKPKHLLDILHSNLFPDVDGSKHKTSFTNLKPFPGATYLLEAGVEFESSRTDRLDITFEGGVLKIPHLVIEDDTKSLFLNLTAFEQLHPSSLPHVTAYAFFMHCLINTAEDVSILHRKGVIENWLGSNQEVADLFADLGRGITIYRNEVYMANVIEGIHEHCKNRINALRGSFIRNNLKKPWGIVSLTVASLLLSLTFIQGFFAMFSYFRPPSPS